MPVASEEDNTYFELVNSLLLHKCFVGPGGCQKIPGGPCSRGYTNTDVRHATAFDEKGYPLYKRPLHEDLRVVPHCKDILLDWKGHCNVEFAGSTYTVLYLYGYLFKGNKKLRVELGNTDDVDREDEITLHLRGRMVTSNDAFWRIMGYDTYPAPDPSVMKIKVKTPVALQMEREKFKTCDLEVYFCRPENAEMNDLSFSAFYQTFDSGYKYPQYALGNEHNLYEIQGLNIKAGRTMYIYRRRHKEKIIVRLGMIYITAGEIYYLRLLLFHYPARSFQDLCTVGATVHTSFQSAAFARGIITDTTEASKCFEEAATISTERELRSLFVTLTLHGFPTVHIYNDPELRSYMLEDFLHQPNMTRPLAENMLLRDLAERLSFDNLTLSEFGLPEPQAMDTMLQRILLQHNAAASTETLLQLENEMPNTDEMNEAFNYIQECLQSKRTAFILILGIAGSGKTCFSKKILALTRSMSMIALGCSSTWLAAQLYDDFVSAHSLYELSVPDEDDDNAESQIVYSRIRNKPEKKELLEHMTLNLWDEMLSNDKECFQAAFYAMNGFRNKIIVCVGDKRQIAPVVANGSPVQITKAHFFSSEFIEIFKVFEFTKNLRLRGLQTQQHDDVAATAYEKQQRYANMLLDLGNGTFNSGEVLDMNFVNEELHSTVVHIVHMRALTSEEEVLQFLLPSGFQYNLIAFRAILAPTNERCDTWNSTIQNLNPKEEHVLYSADKFNDIDDPRGVLATMMTPDVLAKFKRVHVPPHALHLKINDICLLMTTLSKKDGLTKNTRLRIVYISTYRIRVCTLDSTNPTYHTIPRIRFVFKLPFGSYSMHRTQFPLRLAYCITFNKAQGQSLDWVVVDATEPSFSHGHTYVAYSRVHDADHIATYVRADQVLDDGVIITNVVYPDLNRTPGQI